MVENPPVLWQRVARLANGCFEEAAWRESREKRMSLKRCLIGLSVAAFLLIAAVAGAEQEYDPPFQISGILKNINEDSIEVYLPYINKQVTVLVPPDTVIVNRMNPEAALQSLSALAIEDLVVIKGVLQGESFCSEKISFLPSSK